MKRKKYYAIWAENGLGVADSWAIAERSIKYLRRFHVKKCPSFKEAEAMAIYEFNLLRYEIQETEFKGKLPLNFVLNNKNMDSWNKINK